MSKEAVQSIELALRKLERAQARTRRIIELQQERLERNRAFIDWARLGLD